MNFSPPIPWSLVPVGAVVLAPDGVPRRVAEIFNNASRSFTVYLDGLPPLDVEPGGYAYLVALDEDDAVANLRAVGLNPEIIATTEE